MVNEYILNALLTFGITSPLYVFILHIRLFRDYLKGLLLIGTSDQVPLEMMIIEDIKVIYIVSKTILET